MKSASSSALPKSLNPVILDAMCSPIPGAFFKNDLDFVKTSFTPPQYPTKFLASTLPTAGIYVKAIL